MSGRLIHETFFRPAELARERSHIPAVLYNRCRLLLNRCDRRHLFVPIRAMQFQAVVDRREIIFIDHQGGYAVQDGEGGRLITLAWQFCAEQTRASLDLPVKMELVHYRQDVKNLQRRIMSEFPPALAQLIEKAGCGEAPKACLVLPFSAPRP